jgi:hypothetical protein
LEIIEFPTAEQRAAAAQHRQAHLNRLKRGS